MISQDSGAEEAVKEAERRGTDIAPMPGVQNPLLRSGLILAVDPKSEDAQKDDGVLTALEAASLDLDGTQLVVLSACETGLGEVRNGQGVFGLRYAFAVAGAETLVMSLWKVDDRATKKLMAGYYSRLFSGEGRAESLRQIQLEMIKDKKRSHPFYWSSFIVSGQWASLSK
jgi:CHAT domain-containing protein